MTGDTAARSLSSLAVGLHPAVLQPIAVRGEAHPIPAASRPSIHETSPHGNHTNAGTAPA